MICDICDGPLEAAYLVLTVAPFHGPMPSGIEVVETGQPWYVCADCGELIKLPDWGALLRRAVAAREPFPTPTVRAQVIAAIGSLHALLRENIVEVRLVEGG